MGKIGTSELLLILLVALLIFGPSKLPVLGKLAGKGDRHSAALRGQCQLG